MAKAAISNGNRVYRLIAYVAQGLGYKVYLCVDEENKRQFLLQIATGLEYNAGLQRAAYILKLLATKAEEFEADYAKVKTDPKKMLNYQLGFPELIDSFVSREGAGLQVNVVAFRNAENVSDMVPLVNITSKNRLRVDLRTSCWILGKGLKLLVFLESAGVSLDLRNNIVIYPAQHYVVFFDFASAQLSSGTVPMETRTKQISQLAQAVIVALGGNLKTGFIPNDGEAAFGQYTHYIWRLARGGESNAQRAHKAFYDIVDLFWKREFYPFTTKPL